MYGDQFWRIFMRILGLKGEWKMGNHSTDEFLTCGDFVHPKGFNIFAPFTRNWRSRLNLNVRRRFYNLAMRRTLLKQIKTGVSQLSCHVVMQPRLCRSISSKVMVLTVCRSNFRPYRSTLIWLRVWRENFWTARRDIVSTVKVFAWADYTLLVWTEHLSAWIFDRSKISSCMSHV